MTNLAQCRGGLISIITHGKILTFLYLALIALNLVHAEQLSYNIMSAEERKLLKEETKAMFLHAWNAYMRHAWPKDELRPLSCSGRSGKEDNRGHIDDALGAYSLSLVDGMETLLVIGEVDAFADAVQKAINISFAQNQVSGIYLTLI